jgi:hypothetical protein
MNVRQRPIQSYLTHGNMKANVDFGLRIGHTLTTSPPARWRSRRR